MPHWQIRLVYMRLLKVCSVKVSVLIECLLHVLYLHSRIHLNGRIYLRRFKAMSSLHDLLHLFKRLVFS